MDPADAGTEAAIRRIERDLRDELLGANRSEAICLHSAAELLLLSFRLRWLRPAAVLVAAYRAGVVMGRRRGKRAQAP